MRMICCLVAGALAFLTAWEVQADEKLQPNLLFIFADDLTYETINALGFDEVHTPNLDRLVHEGTTFTHAYNQGGYHGAICVASRAMLNTGRFVWHAREADRQLAARQWKKPLWSQLLKQAGYETYLTGKWHVATDAANVFDHTSHVRGGMPNQTEAGYNRPLDGQEDPWSPFDTRFEGFWRGGRHWSEVTADDAEAYLKRATDSDKPFFLYTAFNAPHDPRQAPKEFVDRYPLESIRVPRNFQPEHPHKDEIGCEATLRDERLAPFPRTEHSVKVHRQEYYAIITHLDEQIGRILEALEKTGQRDNTYLFFTADQGLAVGHHGLFGKQNLYDHSIRVPFIAVGDGFPAGKKISTPIYLQDIVPTTLELAGAPVPEEIQFRSLIPLVNGNEEHYPAIYGAYIDRQRMVIEDGFKLLLFPEVPQVLLFDLQKDPDEIENLADKPEHSLRIKKLFARLQELQQETGDTLDLTAKFPKLDS